MVPRIAAAVTLTALMLTAAAAQSPAPMSSAGGNNSAGVGIVTSQSSDQWLTSNLLGAVITNAANEKMGTISDLLLDKNGTPIAAIVSAGGFLGIGGKKVAVDLKSMQFVRSGDGEEKVIANWTKEQLQQAAEFKAYAPPRPEPPVAANRPLSPLGGPAPGAPR